MRVLAATVIALTVIVVSQGVAALFWGYERHVFVIEEGLEPSDQVVAEGLQAIRDGMTVRTKPVATSGQKGESAAEPK